jgi:hypothetical protein
MADEARGYLIRQLEMAWALTTFHLNGLTTEECLWSPAHAGLHVHQDPAGRWRADWPEHERYDLGPPSIAWLTWHLGFWWSMVLDHSIGDAALSRDDVMWPGTADAVRAWLGQLKKQWLEGLEQVTDDDLRSAQRIELHRDEDLAFEVADLVGRDDVRCERLAGGIDNPTHDERLKKAVKLSKAERDDLLAFLKALEVKSDGFERPKLP